MINLGDGPYGEEAADKQVIELEAAGIPATKEVCKSICIPDPAHPVSRLASSGIYIPSAMKGVPCIEMRTFKVVGRLSGWEFDRAWYYWRAHSTAPRFDIPVPDARTLYEAHPEHLRIAGHCVLPEPPWLRDMIELEPVGDGKLTDEIFRIIIAGEEMAQASWDDVDETVNIWRKENSLMCWGGVESYHIDTQEALGVLAEHLRRRS